MAMVLEKRYCEYCGKELVRKQFSKKKEDRAIFMKRKYCDRECMRKAFVKTGEHEQSFSNAHTTARSINELMLKKDKCELCGSTENLDIHHKDEKWRNNEPDNLQCLCRSCHMKIHNPKKTCVICGKPQKGLGYCNKHYIRYKRFGSPYAYRGKEAVE